MSEKIPYWESNRFLRAFIHQTGERSCIACTGEHIKLSIARAPPPLRNKSIEVRQLLKQAAETPKRKPDLLMNTLDGAIKAMETWRKFKDWTQSPTPAPQSKAAVPSESPEVPDPDTFDIQEIPRTIGRLGMPLAREYFEKWFSGELNYSPTPDEEKDEINQKGERYPPSMIEKNSLALDWVLGFKRAADGFEALMKRDYIASPNAIKSLTRVLHRHNKEGILSPTALVGKDTQKIHQEFQFQYIQVEGSLPQKLAQYLKQEVTNRGIPDELTFILGSFNLYVALGRAKIWRVNGGHKAAVTHVYVYVRDGFTFTDPVGEGRSSQYLGHWNRNTLAVVPSHQAVINMMKLDRKGYSIFQNPLQGNFDILYPVRNSDFRAWQSRHHRGGDYIIYTDMSSVMLETPIYIFLPE